MALIVALIVYPSLCYAEPSPAVRYLMSEPVTLFDWGIVRLYEYVDGFANHYLRTQSVQDIYGTVSYDAPRNKILISFVATRKPGARNESAAFVQDSSRKICRTIVQEMRREFLVERKWQIRRTSGIYRFFAHVGTRGQKEPPGCFEEIENITVLKVSVYSHKDPGKLILHGETPLMGKRITYGGSR
jgi:hypothetical protein